MQPPPRRHYLVHLPSSITTRRTLKLLFAAARGIQVVSPEWVLSSLEAERWLPMQGKYVLRPAAEPGRALRGLRVFVASGNKLDRSQTSKLITAAGGTALSNHKRAQFSVGCVFTHEGVKKRDEEWLINAVLQGGVPEADLPTPRESAQKAGEGAAAAGDESEEEDGNSEEF